MIRCYAFTGNTPAIRKTKKMLLKERGCIFMSLKVYLHQLKINRISSNIHRCNHLNLLTKTLSHGTIHQKPSSHFISYSAWINSSPKHSKSKRAFRVFNWRQLYAGKLHSHRSIPEKNCICI